MAMSWQQTLEFNNLMNSGNNYMNSGAYKERGAYFSDAKNCYYRAMQEYDRAYDLARSNDDYKQKDAYKARENARHEFSEVAYREDDYIRKNGYGR